MTEPRRASRDLQREPGAPKTGPECIKKHALGSRTRWTIVGQGIYTITQFLALILLTQIAGVADLGRFGLASAIVTPVYWLLELGLRTSQATDVTARYHLRDFLLLRLATTLLGMGLITAIGLAYFEDADTVAIMVIFGLAKGVETLSEICYGVFERHGAMKSFARSMTIRGVFSLLVFALLLVATKSTSTAFLAQLMVWGAVFLLHDLPRARGLGGADPGRFRIGALLITALGSWQLGLSQFIASLQTAVPRFILDRALGIEAVGIFTAISYLLQASNMTATAVSRSILGLLATLLHEGRAADFRRILLRYEAITCAIGIALLLAVWIIGAEAMGVMFGPEFLDERLTLIFMALAAIFRAVGILLQSAPLARRRFDTILWLRLIDLATITAFTFTGVLLADLGGAALGLAAASFVQMAVLYVMMRRVTRP